MMMQDFQTNWKEGQQIKKITLIPIVPEVTLYFVFIL